MSIISGKLLPSFEYSSYSYIFDNTYEMKRSQKLWPYNNIIMALISQKYDYTKMNISSVINVHV